MNKNTSAGINKRLKSLEEKAVGQSGFSGNIFLVGAISDLDKLDSNVFHPDSIILYEDSHLTEDQRTKLDAAFKKRVDDLKEPCGIYGDVRYHVSEDEI
jgi:hypothetical protein